MTALRLALPLLSLVFSCGLARALTLADEIGPAGEMLLAVTGTVLMADGSPAPGATVESTAEEGESPRVTRTNSTGRFQLRGMFGNGARLHARSVDGNQQTTLFIPSVAVRSVSAAPIELILAPAINHEVAVLADGRPVEGAHVAASGVAFNVHGVSGPDGKVQLRLPARERLQELVAWHRVLGVRGRRALDTRPQDMTELSLIPPGPLRIHVVDLDGNPIPGLELGVNVRAEDSDWAPVSKIEAARVRTDAGGAAPVPWAPREKLIYVDASMIGSDWKIDETDLNRIRDRIITVHARRRIRVEGRLVMPTGASPEGLLITGFGFGPTNHGDIPYARARADGSFLLYVPSDHGYGLGIEDLQWASDTWSGMILATETSKPAEITMSVQRATPLTVRVTRGQQRVPVADTWVEVGSSADMDWVDASGKKRSARSGIRSWLRTDDNGVAHAGAGRGKYNVRLSSRTWNEERTIVVSPGMPVEVEFYRPWEGQRQITGELISDGKRFKPSPTLVARAWTPRRSYLPLEIRPETDPDGTFKAVFDAETLSLFFNDPDQRRSGFAQLGLNDSSVALNLVPMATYSGTVRDENAQPIVGQTLSLYVKTSGPVAIATQTTNEAGGFRFAAVPANVPLALNIGNGATRPEYYLIDGDRLFLPGEVRENDEVRPYRRNSPAPIARPSLPLAGRIENACRNVRSSGMHALVVLKGDDSKDVSTLTDQLLNADHDANILKYLPVQVEPAELKTEVALLNKCGWPIPAPGTIVLVALSGNQETIATKQIDTGEPAASGIAEGFLKQQIPPTRDALAGLTTARKEARTTGRRVWVVYGGPRCGPCFRLGRWIDEHHATLEKDFVIFKVMGGLDEHAAEVINELPVNDGDGIPWHAITEPDGTILATSHGSLGNIGFPSSVEGIRHFRQMLDGTVRTLTAAEVDALIKSLSPKQ